MQTLLKPCSECKWLGRSKPFNGKFKGSEIEADFAISVCTNDEANKDGCKQHEHWESKIK